MKLPLLLLLCTVAGAQTAKPTPTPKADIHALTCTKIVEKSWGCNVESEPIDVAPIIETYWMEMLIICMDTCPAPRTSLTEPKDGSWRQLTRSTCADKTRFLMTAEDGSKHCIALTSAPEKTSQEGGKS